MTSRLLASQLVLALFAIVLSATPAFSQKNRTIQWPEIPINFANAKGSSSYSQELSQTEALEIIDVAVGGKPITMGEAFAGDDDWLNNLTFRVKNVSSLSISIVQMNLFLTEIMPGGPQVTLCYGCGGVGDGQPLMPGKEAEMKLVFYSWVTEQINKKSSLSMITKAEIHNIMITLTDGRKWITGCLRAANPKNACPKTTAKKIENGIGQSHF